MEPTAGIRSLGRVLVLLALLVSGQCGMVVGGGGGNKDLRPFSSLGRAGYNSGSGGVGSAPYTNYPSSSSSSYPSHSPSSSYSSSYHKYPSASSSSSSSSYEKYPSSASSSSQKHPSSTAYQKYPSSSSSSSTYHRYPSSSSSSGSSSSYHKYPSSSSSDSAPSSSSKYPSSSSGSSSYKYPSSSSSSGSSSSSSSGSYHRYPPSSSSSSTPSRGRYANNNNNNRHLTLFEVEVPVYKFRGEEARLECQYDRGSDPLYSVKWYKDDQEFYRYLSHTKDPKQTFDTPGIQVDLQRSNAKKVQLRNLTFNSTGVYRCEVSADSPHFHTFESQKLMMVVELPERGPSIEGGKSHYQVGETVRLNCTAAKSKPAARLTWFINQEEVKAPNLVEYFPWVHRDGLESKRLGLTFMVNQSHFLTGRLELKCKATVATFYTVTKEEDATISNEEPVILQQQEEHIHVLNGADTVMPTLAPTTLVAAVVLATLLVSGLAIT